MDEKCMQKCENLKRKMDEKVKEEKKVEEKFTDLLIYTVLHSSDLETKENVSSRQALKS